MTLLETKGSSEHLQGSRLGRVARMAALAGIRAARTNLTTITAGYAIRKAEHVGSPAHPADSRTHQAIERALYGALNDVVIVGEEVDREGFVDIDTLVAIVDPIDGTAPAQALLSEFSSVVLLYGYTVEGLKPMACAIATGNAYVVCLDEEGTIGCHDLLSNEIVEVDLWKSRPVGPNQAIAVVGAKARDRETFKQLSAVVGEATLFNCGGSPTIVGLLSGELAASVAVHPQTVWDAAHLLIGVQAGLTAVLLNEPDRALSRDDVYQLFTDPPIQKAASTKKTVPAFVVGQHEQAVLAIAERVSAMTVAER